VAPGTATIATTGTINLNTTDTTGAATVTVNADIDPPLADLLAADLGPDHGRRARADAAGAILMASENAVKTSLEAIQALGGAGYTKDYPVERYLRDAKLYDIGAGTNEIRRYLIGRELVGQ
jgi:alkylation response protein AidB-like acyl-CoA dehydrogenase